jgi:hypothetical protein
MTRRLAFAVLTAGLFAAAAHGQEPTLFLGDSPNPTAAKEVKNILLRPNTGAPFYPYIANTSPNDRTVTARLLNAAGREIARVDNIAAPANSRTPVTFRPLATNPAPAKPGEADQALAILGNQVRLQLLDEKNKEIGKSDLALVFDVPNRYAQATAAFTGNRDTANELKITVTVSPVADGPVKCKLDLTHVPGLILESIKDGAFSAEVAATGGTAVLVARNLRFTGEPQKGWVAVTVDGYERAFLFETAFDGSTPQRPPAVDVITVACRPVAAPTDKFPVKIEVDQPSRADLYIEFGFDKSGTGVFENRILPGDRDRSATLRLGGADGALVFASTVKDWAFDVDASGVLGARTLRARLLAAKGPTPDPANDTEMRADRRQVTFDDSPPVVKLTAPLEHVRGTPLKVTVSAVDAESGIDRVLVFAGDPPPADVRGPVRGKVFLAEPGTAAGTFTATLPMADLKGPAVVGTRVFNGAGLPTNATAEVMLVDPKAKPTLGDIKGVVEQGSPPRKQPAKPVWLLDEKQAAVLKKSETNDKGEFAFKDLAPGNYVVRSDKPTDYSTGNKAVVVEAGKTSEVTLELSRMRKKPQSR